MKSTRVLAVIAAILLSGLAVSSQAFGQSSTGTIVGTVHDAGGAIIPGAQIVVKNTDTGVERTIKSSDQGEFYVPEVAIGSYSVTASVAGFKTEVRRGITVSVGAAVTVDFALAAGDIQETVDVTADSTQIDTTTSTVGGLVNDHVIRELPLNGRDWLQLATLQPNVIQVSAQTRTASNTAQRGNGLELSIAGTRPTDNMYRIDGLVVNDYANSGPGSALGVNLGVDAIQEFTVLSNTYSAEFGRSGGGVVNAVLKSGANEFHGGGFEFLRNSAMDARNFFDGPTVPPFRRNQFGGSLGGPIQHDKTFFFVNYEGLRQYLSLSSNVNTLTEAARNGDLVSGHVAVNPKIVPYLSLFPLPNGPISGDLGQYLTSVPQIGSENYVVGKIDHTFSDKMSISGSYSFDSTSLTQRDALNEKTDATDSRRQNVVVSLQRTISASVLSSTRAGVSRTYADNGVGLTAGANPLLVDPSLGFVPGLFMGTFSIPQVQSPGGVGADNSNLFGYTSVQAYEDVYWTHNRHNIKIGANVERILSNQDRSDTPNGNWSFNSLSDFLTLKPSLFTGNLPSSDPERGGRQTVFGAYFADDFRVKPNLTLNLGLRYQFASIFNEVNGRLANLINLTDPAPTVGPLFGSNPTSKDFEPRIGFAWDPWKNGKTSIRGGFGIFDVLPLAYIVENGIDRTLPFYVAAQFSKPPASTFPNQIIQLVTPATARVVTVEYNPHRAYVMQYNLNIQRQLTKDLSINVGYVGSTGVHEPLRIDDVDVVPPNLVTRTASGQYLFPTTGTVQRINPAFGRITATYFAGHSTYNALMVNLTKRFSHNLTAQVSYRWDRSIDNGDSTFSSSQNSNSVTEPYPYDLNLNRGPSDYDIPQSLVASYMWVIPTPENWKGFIHAVASGWQWGGIFTYQSGAPFSVTIPNDQARTGTSATGSSAPSGQRPNVIAGCNQTTGDPGNYINESCFTFPALGTIGNLGRNTLRVPDTVNFDMSLFKNQNLYKEKLRAQFRFEVFNIFNHPSFTPTRTQLFQVTGTTGMLIPSASRLVPPTVLSSRQIQVGLKLMF